TRALNQGGRYRGSDGAHSTATVRVDVKRRTITGVEMTLGWSDGAPCPGQHAPEYGDVTIEPFGDERARLPVATDGTFDSVLGDAEHGGGRLYGVIQPDATAQAWFLYQDRGCDEGQIIHFSLRAAH